MTNRTAKSPDVDAYIAAQPPAVRAVLRELRRVVRAAAPGAEECVSYRMPVYKQAGVVVYFAAFKQHIGLFPPVSGDARIEKAIARYAGPKGNLRFPLDEPLPFALIGRIVTLRVKQNLAKAALRAASKSAPRPRKPSPGGSPR